MTRLEIQYHIRNIYEERRLQATMREKAWQDAIFSHNPELESMHQDLRALRYDVLLAQTQVEIDEEKLTLLETTLQETEERYKTMLLHYKQENFHHCTTCEDRGRLTNGTSCPACYSQTLRTVLREMDARLLPPVDQNWENFDLNIFSPDNLEVEGRPLSPRRQAEQYQKFMRNYVDHFPEDKRSFFFTGKTGTGKTYLASAIVNALLDRGYLAFFLPVITWEEELGRLRTLQRSFSADEEDIQRARNRYHLILDADFLVLDDFGMTTGALADPLSEIHFLLQERKSKDKPTLFTTNLRVHELGKVYDERLLSRILERFVILPFVGDDLRIRQRKT